MKPTGKKITITFADSAYEALSQLADQKGKPMDYVIRDAIQLEKWLVDALEEGCKVLLEYPSGEIKEMLFR